MLRDGEEVDRLTSDSHGRKHTNWNHTVNGYYNGTFGNGTSTSMPTTSTVAPEVGRR